MIYIITEVYCPTNGILEGLRVDFIKEFWLHFPLEFSWLHSPPVGSNMADMLLCHLFKHNDDEMKKGTDRTFLAEILLLLA